VIVDMPSSLACLPLISLILSYPVFARQTLCLNALPPRFYPATTAPAPPHRRRPSYLPHIRFYVLLDTYRGLPYV